MGLRLFSVALSLICFLRQAQDDKWPALHRCIALCCPDFPPLNKLRSDSLACSEIFKEAKGKYTNYIVFSEMVNNNMVDVKYKPELSRYDTNYIKN